MGQVVSQESNRAKGFERPDPFSNPRSWRFTGSARASLGFGDLDGARAEQVGEHLGLSTALFMVEYECYPEAKILSGVELRALHQRLGGWPAVGRLIGASEAFARQNAKNHAKTS